MRTRYACDLWRGLRRFWALSVIRPTGRAGAGETRWRTPSWAVFPYPLGRRGLTDDESGELEGRGLAQESQSILTGMANSSAPVR